MRKAAHEAFKKITSDGLNEYQLEEALVLAHNAMHNPAAWEAHIRSVAAGMMLRSLYNQSPVSYTCDENFLLTYGL